MCTYVRLASQRVENRDGHEVLCSASCQIVGVAPQVLCLSSPSPTSQMPNHRQLCHTRILLSPVRQSFQELGLPFHTSVGCRPFTACAVLLPALPPLQTGQQPEEAGKGSPNSRHDWCAIDVEGPWCRRVSLWTVGEVGGQAWLHF